MKIEKHIRFKKYIDFFKEEKDISMKAYLNLAELENIPLITARRDLKELINLNYIYQELGLIKLVENKEYETTRIEKQAKNKEEKNNIAKLAVKELNADEIFISAGTTMENFVKNIDRPIKIVYTNGFEIARLANSNKNIHRVVIIGGKLRLQSSALCGPIANKTVEDLRFSQSFITVTNIDKNFFLYNNNDDEAELIKLVIKNSNNVICLVDSSKFNPTPSGSKIVDSSKIDLFLTNEEIIKKEFENIKSHIDIK